MVCMKRVLTAALLAVLFACALAWMTWPGAYAYADTSDLQATEAQAEPDQVAMEATDKKGGDVAGNNPTEGDPAPDGQQNPDGDDQPEGDAPTDNPAADNPPSDDPSDDPADDPADQPAQEETTPAATLTYRAHVENLGWLDPVKEGQMAGTEGQSLRMEAIEFTLTSEAQGAIQIQSHVQNIGWQPLADTAGTTGLGLRMEAVRLMLTGDLSQFYDIVYRAHVQNIGWQDWVSNGTIAGTSGQSLRIEALEVKLAAKPAKTAPTEGIIDIRTQAHVENIGWQDAVLSGGVSGTTGQSLRVEALRIALDAGVIGGTVECRSHVQNIGWQDWVASGSTSGTEGCALRMEATQIRLTGNIADVYDIVYRAHVQNIGWQPWTLNGGIAGTEGQSLRVEALQVKLVKKGADFGVADGAYTLTIALDLHESLRVPDDSEADGTRMQLAGFDMNSFAQRYYVRNVNGGITVQAATSGLFLTDAGNSTVIQSAQRDDDTQRWALAWNGGLELKNLASGQVLSLDGGVVNGAWAITVANDAVTAAPRWMLSETGLVPEGTYIVTNTNSGRVLDVAFASRRNNANVQIHSSNGGNNQKFNFSHLGANQYSIRNASTQRAMQASGGNVAMYTWNGSYDERWSVELVGPKTFRFVNIATGTAMDIAGRSTADDANVVVADGTADSQRFTLTPTALVLEVVDIGVPAIWQNPELPTGCESVALTEALCYYGFGISKTTIADNYMPWSGGDFVYSFMGNPHSGSGAAIMAPGIANTANSFLVSNGSDLRAYNITGTTLGNLYQYLDQGIPVVVWNTMYMTDPGYVQAVQDGYAMRGGTHAVTLSGYNPFNNTVLVADPLSGSVWRDRGRFEYLYDIMGRQAVIIC